MKYALIFLSSNRRSGYFAIILASLYITGCTGKVNTSFFYANDEKIELVIPGDTLGALLHQRVLLPSGYTETAKEEIRDYSDSVTSSLNYKPAGFLTGAENIKLLISPTQAKSKSKLEKEANVLKSVQFSNLIINAGYLARIKKNNQPVFVTNEIIVFFNPGTSDTLINETFSKFGLTIKEHNRLGPTEYLVFLNDKAQNDVLITSHKLRKISFIKFAQVNLIYVKKFLNGDPDYSDRQWNLNNDGRFAPDAEFDADIDADKAWEQFTAGNENTIIAILDDGFDIWHGDFHDNIFYNQPEVGGQDYLDDDDNNYTDDTVGWNFTDRSAAITMYSEHGTAVTGVAAAKKNGFGISGVCPDCKILPVQTTAGSEIASDGMAFRYAITMKAKVINCSWALRLDFVPANISQAISDAESAGIVTICALDNDLQNNCEDKKDLFSLSNTLCITRSTCKDIFDNTCFANFIDLAAPTAAYQDARGILKIYTTDLRGPDVGYNNHDYDCGKPTTIDPDYTGCFWGTSASTAHVSGATALVYSLNPDITAKQMRYLLQDCADKIDTMNGHYSRKNGYSNFETSNTSTLGYGRLNAYEAVKIAAPIETGGRNGVDIFLRDNILDWGNTEQPSNYLFNSPRGHIGHYRSQDIKVDAPDASDRYGTAPANSIEFEDFSDEKPISGKDNKVYVRIHNRGFNIADEVYVKLYWVYGGTALPELWDTFPDDLPPGGPTWHFLGSDTLNNLDYSGASVAYTTDDKSQIASFTFSAPPHPAGTRNHYCLAALIDSPEDPITQADFTNFTLLDEVTPIFNNVTHRNYSLEIPDEGGEVSDMLKVRNPYPFPVPVKISIVNPTQINFTATGVLIDSVITLPAKSERNLILKINRRSVNKHSELKVLQEFILPGKKKKKVFGGFDFVFM